MAITASSGLARHVEVTPQQGFILEGGKLICVAELTACEATLPVRKGGLSKR
jgi:hypothetical protein